MSGAACGDPAGTVGAFLCRAGQHLRAAAVETPRLEARLLLAHALGCRTEDLLRDPRAPVPPEAARRFGALLRRRLGREPVAHLLGAAEFWSLAFAVSPATLIPRPDSETLIEAALAAFPQRGAVRRVLDLGTGTGCLLLAALSEFPDAAGVGVDAVPEAAALARRNAAALGFGSRAGFVAASWGAALAAGRFDLVLSNPPYIETGAIPELAPEVARHEPRSALTAARTGWTRTGRSCRTSGGCWRREAGRWWNWGEGSARRWRPWRERAGCGRSDAGPTSAAWTGRSFWQRTGPEDPTGCWHAKNHLAGRPGGTRFSPGFARCSA